MDTENVTCQWENSTEFYTPEETHVMPNFTDATENVTKYADDVTKYLTGSSRFFIFAPFRVIIAIIGIIGNVLTLQIIKNLKVRSNGHILMMYLAVADISMCLVSPVVLYEMAEGSIIDAGKYWKELCIVKDYVDICTSVMCVTSYTLLSVDR